jgi:hypothetical protein
MPQYFEVKIEFSNEDENGKVKKQREVYLVDAISVTESEAKVMKYLEFMGETRDYEVKGSNESKISEVIESK